MSPNQTGNGTLRVLPLTVTEPTTEPVTLAELRGQVRIDDNAEDAMLYGYLVAAREHIEGLMNRPIVPRPVRATFESWPDLPLIDRLPFTSTAGQTAIELLMPVTSVDAIHYTAVDGTTQPWTAFVARTDSGGITRVRPAATTDWPVLGNDPLITIDATAGFARTPKALREAVLLLAGHFYLNREEVLTGTRLVALQLPLGLDALIERYRWRWLG